MRIHQAGKGTGRRARPPRSGSAPAAGLALMLALGLDVAPAQPATWSMFRADPQHTGYLDADAPADSLVAWVYSQPEVITYSSPAVAADGTIYIGTEGEGLLALWPGGTLRWRFEAMGDFRHSSPAVAADGTIYIGGSDGRLYAVRPNGTLAWTFDAGAPIKTSPNVGPDGTVYFGADDGRLYAVRPDCSLAWTYLTGDTIRSSPAVGPDGAVYFGSEDFYFYALNPDGTRRWRAATGDRIKLCSPAVSDSGTVYIGSYDGFLYAFSETNGALRWAYYTGHPIRSSPAIGPRGTVYVGAGSRLYALGGNGRRLWQFDAGSDIVSSPAYLGDDQVLCFGTEGGRLFVVDSSGHEDWGFTAGSPILSSPAPTRFGLICVADQGGRIWAFGRLDKVEVPRPPAGPAALSLQPVPNPATGVVTFLSEVGAAVSRGGPAVELRVCDLRGRLVAVLRRTAGGAFVWDGRDLGGRPVAPGVYLYGGTLGIRPGRVAILR